MANQQSKVAKWRFALIKSDLPATVKHALLTLAVHMNADGSIPPRVTPGVRLLAAEMGRNKDSVTRSLSTAAKQGWLSIEEGTRGARNRYSAVIPDSKVSEPEGTLSEGEVSGFAKKVSGFSRKVSEPEGTNQQYQHITSSSEPSEEEVRALARERAKRKPNVRDLDALAAKILHEDRALLVEEWRQRRRRESILEAIARCQRCNAEGKEIEEDGGLSGHFCTHPEVAYAS